MKLKPFATSPQERPARVFMLSGLVLLLLALAACTTAPPRPAPPVVMPVPAPAPAPVALPAPAPIPPAPAPAPVPAPPAPVVVAPPPAPAVVQEPLGKVASASTPLAYRQYGAQHLYERHRERIFKGKMPPLLYAVGVLNVAIDGRGEVRRIEWMREPKHAPEVVAEIERMVRAASPFPAPVRMGGVIYTEVWLWDKSGRFQLDTLTEGQLSALPEPPRSAVRPVSAPAPSPAVRQPAKPAARPSVPR